MKGKTMAGKQREYTAEFKREAIRLLETSGKSGVKNCPGVRDFR